VYPALLTLVVGGGACAQEEPGKVDKPLAPDMSELVADYQAPSGILDQATMDALEADVRRSLAELSELALDQIVDRLREALASNAAVQTGEATLRTNGELATRTDALTVTGEGYLVVTRICDGWSEAPSVDPTNGFMRFWAGFTEAGLDPVLWGGFSSCQYLVGGQKLLFGAGARPEDGALRVFVGRGMAVADFGTQPVLVAVDLDTEIEGVKLPIQLDFRLDLASRRLEFRIPSASGPLVASTGAGALLGVRAANGEFTCDLVSLQCQNETGDVVSF
jgi:hypothetical protein